MDNRMKMNRLEQQNSKESSKPRPVEQPPQQRTPAVSTEQPAHFSESFLSRLWQGTIWFPDAYGGFGEPIATTTSSSSSEPQEQRRDSSTSDAGSDAGGGGGRRRGSSTSSWSDLFMRKWSTIFFRFSIKNCFISYSFLNDVCVKLNNKRCFSYLYFLNKTTY